MASGRQGTKPQQAAAADQEFDPKYEWQENDTNFLLRLHLSGFRKEDFRVQVDSVGLLTVRGQRADGGKHSRFNKVFQLPATSNLDDITGRFDAGVLTLTVPKRPAAPPTTIEEIKRPSQPVEEDATKKAAEQVKEQVDAKRGKPEQEQHKAAPPPAARKEEGKPKAETAAPSTPATDKKQAVPTPSQADGDRRATKAVDRESLAESARRRAEEERANKAAAAAEEAERERTAGRHGWKERVAEELEGLARSDWAEGFVETVKKNKEVIAAAVAAFSLGLFVSSRLISRN